MSSERSPAANYQRVAPDLGDDYTDPQETLPASSWRPQRVDACRGCGSHVTDQYRKVRGDNDDVVHACPNCSDKHGAEREAAGLPTIGGGGRR